MRGMNVGELIDKMIIDDQSLPVKYSDGCKKEDVCRFSFTLHGHGALRDYEVQNISVSPYGVFVNAKAAERSA